MTKQKFICLLLKCVPSFVSILCALIPATAGYLVASSNARTEIDKLQVEFNLALERNQRENIYQIKKEAIFNALKMMDTYYSWQNFPKKVPARKETTELALTEEARDSYNRLCVTCTNATLPEAFLDCIFGSSENGEIPLELYNKFRNEARKELGLESLTLDIDRTFISIVSTEALSAESPRQAATSQGAP